MRAKILCAAFLCALSAVFALSGKAQQNSAYGWALSPHDTLRVLIFFAEVEYDTSEDSDLHPDGTDLWAVGELPAYADELFDPVYRENPEGRMTQYYSEISLGNLIVLGDYYPELIRIRQSVIGNSPHIFMRELSNRFASDSAFVTRNGLTPPDFDFWLPSPGIGKKKIPVSEGYEGVDHIMIIFRNYHRMRTDHGQAGSTSNIRIAGKSADTYSMFGGGRRWPFGVMRHEINHLFLGGNNFHAGGGNSARFSSYQLHVQGGWAMMGAANSSLLTCSGWDRHRLGWKAPGSEFAVSARDDNGMEVNGDLDPANDPGGIYILRDFVTRGDALRIKLPFIPDEEFSQWLWIENHTTKRQNGSPFDVFQFEHHECVSKASPGLYALIQIDADEKTGSNIFNSVMADYLRPVPANGNYDFFWEDEPVQTEDYCVNGVAYRPYVLHEERENPLTGNHEQEFSFRDDAPPFGLITPDEMLAPMTRRTAQGFARMNFSGSSDHAFFEGGAEQFGIGTNPSSANVLTTVNSRRPRKPDPRDNRTVYLNGISFRILHTFPDGSIKLEVRFDDREINERRRWCASEIVLSNHCEDGPDLSVSGELILDRGETPVRLDRPDTLADGTLSFTDATVLRVSAGAEAETRGTLELRADSRAVFEADSRYSMLRGARTVLNDSSAIHFRKGAAFSGKGRFRIGRGARIYCEDAETCAAVRRRTCQKRRVVSGRR